MADETATQPFAGLELELKFRLADAAQAAAVERASRGTARPSIEQRNHFFDTPERDLARAKYTLRLREELGRGYLLTAKGPERRSADGMLTEKAEREGPLAQAAAEALLAGAASALDALGEMLGADCSVYREMLAAAGGKPASYLASFSNTRTPIDVRLDAAGKSFPLVLELDRTTFPNGRVDFELEVELRGLHSEEERDRLADAVRQLVKSAGIALEPASSKAKRLFEIIGARGTA